VATALPLTRQGEARRRNARGRFWGQRVFVKLAQKMQCRIGIAKRNILCKVHLIYLCINSSSFVQRLGRAADRMVANQKHAQSESHAPTSNLRQLCIMSLTSAVHFASDMFHPII
jgi:hypothetical protein